MPLSGVASGFSCACSAHTPPISYVPTVFDNHGAVVKYDGKDINFSLWDTAGQEGYARIRTLSYPKTDIFLMCFSVVDRISFSNVQNRWLPEVDHHCPGVLSLLIGLKTDLRNDPDTQAELKRQGTTAVTKEEAEEYAKSLNLAAYLECSALTRDGLEEIFQSALIRVMKRKYGSGGGESTSSEQRKRKQTCALL
eukprot:TRINITY_DN1456_c0_g1_i3.p1 TRINITY_DN1456_c0_g1~~TRINITY_DN1456_c0_g1_i3.p1  ORF type:complete len:195 (+),score=78.70 TRINITY_DN1456_c0_g1_i3:525-1109(+)